MTASRLTAALAGRYRVEREVGAGGMATVFLAEDLKHNRKVAIKVLREDLAESVGAQRFLREIAIAAQLQHPNILALLDSGEANGLLYYVMPYVEGPSLRTRLATSGELPVAEAIRLLVEVTDALAYAHEHGVVHRDIKPDNVMLSGRHALVTDFGVARAVSQAGSGHTVTSLGVALGTPAYMAPEQATADPNVDHRADIYSVGVLAYELLTGQTPFSAATPQQVLAKQVTEAPDPVSRHRPALSAELEAVVMRCLAKRPADRWQSAGDLLAAMEPLATPSGGTAPTSARIAPTAVRRRLPVPVIALAGVLLAVAAWIGLRPGSASAEERSIAVLPFELVAGDSTATAFVLGVHGEIVTQLSRVESLSVASRASSSAYRDSGKPAREIAGELGVTTLLTGSVQRSGGRIRLQVSLDDAQRGRQIWAETYDRELTAENLFAIQGDVAEQVAAALRVQLTPGQVAEIERPATRNLVALDLYHDALLRWDNRGGTDSVSIPGLERALALDSTFSRAWGLLAQHRSWLLRNGTAFDTLPAWNAVRRVNALAPASLEAVLAAGYYHYYAKADFQRALAEFQAAQRILPASVEITSATGLLQRRLGRNEDAMASFMRATELDPRDVEALRNVSEQYSFFGRYADALEVADRIVAIMPSYSNAWALKVYSLLGLGDTTRVIEAANSARRVIDDQTSQYFDYVIAVVRRDWAAQERLARAASSPFSSNAFDWRLAVALARHFSGDRAGARAMADSTIRAADAVMQQAARRPGDPFGMYSISQIQAAVARAIAGDSARAVRDAERAFAAYNRSVDGADGPYMETYIALVYTLVGRRGEAIEHLRGALGVPRGMTPGQLRLEPWWDSLRGIPAFEELARGR